MINPKKILQLDPDRLPTTRQRGLHKLRQFKRKTGQGQIPSVLLPGRQHQQDILAPRNAPEKPDRSGHFIV